MTKVHLHNLGRDIITEIQSGGASGLSAYQIALNNRFIGSERQWLDSLRGDDGVSIKGEKGDVGDGFDISKVYGSLIELKADESNPLITEGNFVLINSEDEDNGSLFVKKDGIYMFQAKLVGVKGNRGERGEKGVGVVVKGSKPTEGDLPLVGLEGDAYWVGERLYIWSNNPLEIVEPGFVRGNSLKGDQGIEGKPGSIGLKGEKGSDANVTSANIKNALKYTPANQETTNSHASLNATKTTKGHMQVGDGLKVTDGIVSVESNFNTSYGISTPIEDFPLGVTEVSVLTNSTNQNYIELRSLVSSLMGYEITSGIPFRFFMKVIKRASNSFRQEVIVTSGYTKNIGVEYFRLHRETSSGNNESWHITVTTMTGKGSPENDIPALKGCLYFDAVNGQLYKKTTGTTVGTSTGWEEVVTPKQFLSLSNAGGNISIGTVPFDIKLSTVLLNNNIPYNATNGHFTLTGGKTYKIQYVANVNTTGRVEIRVVTATGANANSVFGLWGGGTSDKSPNMYSTIFQPSSTADYKLRVTVNSASGSTISHYTSHLEIIEI